MFNAENKKNKIGEEKLNDGENYSFTHCKHNCF